MNEKPRWTPRVIEGDGSGPGERVLSEELKEDLHNALLSIETRLPSDWHELPRGDASEDARHRNEVRGWSGERLLAYLQNEYALHAPLFTDIVMSEVRGLFESENE